MLASISKIVKKKFLLKLIKVLYNFSIGYLMFDNCSKTIITPNSTSYMR